MNARLMRSRLVPAVALAVLLLGGCNPEGEDGAQAQAPAAMPSALSEEGPARGPVVGTSAGRLEGVHEKGVYKFKGVPYGASTAGDGRFMPPRPVEPWQGTRPARDFGPICPQRGVVAEGAGEDYPAGPIPQLPQSEDCLVLNVWTPALQGERPVMVWLHGRGFGEGAGSEGWYDGSFLAARHDVVVITLNHRLNAFGYLELGELAGEAFEGSGVAGMLDIVAALEWVAANIEGFGGDPENVTIFGESGGGAKVSTLMAMPDAEGLFDKAIIQSGPSLRGRDRNDATANARALLEALGLDESEVEALQRVPFEEISAAVGALQSASANREGGPPRFGFSPVVGSRYFPEHPFDPEASPHAREVTLMIGTTADEMTLLLAMAGDLAYGDLSQEALGERARALLGERAGEVLAVYRDGRPQATPGELYVAILSDLRFRIPSIRLAERQLAASERPVYMYLFAWESDYGDPPLRAAHALEIPFVFGTSEMVPLTGSAPGQDVLTAAVSGAWASFARRGDPNHPGLPDWAAYDTEARETLIFDMPSYAEPDPRRAERLVWEGAGVTGL